MANYDFKQFEAKVVAAKEWLAKEYRGLRTGRAAPAILDGVMASAYGSMMPLKQVASVGVEDARTLRVQPFDASLLKDIERAISAANLGVGTASDGTIVRVTRDEAWKDIQEKVRTSELTEDDKFRLKDELQKRIDKANEEMEKAFGSKEKEMGS